MEIHEKNKANEFGFNANDGWLQNFKIRFGVRLLKIQGERLFAQPQLVDTFKQKLRSNIDELGLTGNNYQIKRMSLQEKNQLPELKWRNKD